MRRSVLNDLNETTGHQQQTRSINQPKKANQVTAAHLFLYLEVAPGKKFHLGSNSFNSDTNAAAAGAAAATAAASAAASAACILSCTHSGARSGPL